jgi:nucleoside-diphosphate-sugar epimerase
VLFEADFKRNFIHIQDVAGVFLFALQHFDAMRGRAFNVGLDDANLSKRELCQKIQTHVPGFLYFEAPLARTRTSAITSSLTPGWQPRVLSRSGRSIGAFGSWSKASPS